LLGAGFAIVVTSVVLLIGEMILLWWVLKHMHPRSETTATSPTSKLFQGSGDGSTGRLA
jgi:hypothetical protein